MSSRARERPPPTSLRCATGRQRARSGLDSSVGAESPPRSYAAGGNTAFASNTGPSTQTRFIASPSVRDHRHRAAGAAADGAGHEFLERYLAGHAEATRDPRGGLQHRRRAAGEHLDLGARRAHRATRARRGEVGDVAVEAAREAASVARRLGTPQSSSSGMQAIAAGGMPGTRIVDGRARNGNGISEPISTSGRQRASRARLERLGEEHHRRDADAAADQQRARALRRWA